MLCLVMPLLVAPRLSAGRRRRKTASRKHRLAMSSGCSRRFLYRGMYLVGGGEMRSDHMQGDVLERKAHSCTR